MNFLIETLDAIKESGHQESDVMFIGSEDGQYRMTIEKFKTSANFDYDSGFGSQSIAEDLIIYFKDKNYIKRGEYDGSEWWEYNKPLTYLSNDSYQDFNKLEGSMWDSVEKLNQKN